MKALLLPFDLYVALDSTLELLIRKFIFWGMCSGHLYTGIGKFMVTAYWLVHSLNSKGEEGTGEVATFLFPTGFTLKYHPGHVNSR